MVKAAGQFADQAGTAATTAQSAASSAVRPVQQAVDSLQRQQLLATAHQLQRNELEHQQLREQLSLQAGSLPSDSRSAGASRGQGDYKRRRFSLKCVSAKHIDVPEVLITAESQNVGKPFHLPGVDAEATAIQAAFGGAENAEVQRNISASDLGELLAGRKVWVFSGHGDAPLQSETTLGFVGAGGGFEAVSMDALVNTVRPHLGAGKLELIVLNADYTARLAAALSEQAYVVYWETVVNDEAARVFVTALARSLASGEEPLDAFSKARAAVCMVTEPWEKQTNSSGVGGPGNSVQKFDVDVDPKDATRVDRRTARLILPGDGRGRLAAGRPKLVCPGGAVEVPAPAPAPAPVPALR